MADYEKVARRAARRYGLDPNIFVRQIRQESGFDPHARSGAGAVGIAQIMPATARGWGVDPTKPVDSLFAAAKNMARYVKQYGSYRNALVAYNAGPGRVGGPLPAETRNYVHAILGGANPTGLRHARAMLGGPQRIPGMRTPNTTLNLPTASGAVSLPQGSTGLLDLIGSLQGQKQQQQAPQSAPLPVPSFLAQATLPQGYQAPTSSGAPESPQSRVRDLIGALQGPGEGIPGQRPQGSQKIQIPGVQQAATQQGRQALARQARPGQQLRGLGHAPVRATSVGGVHDTSGLAGFPARDYFAPAGSPVAAPVSGRVYKESGHDPRLGAVQGAGGPLGWSVYIRGRNGKLYYLTHMGSRTVRVGQTVRRGEVIGTVANYHKYGRPDHIHMGVHG